MTYYFPKQVKATQGFPIKDQFLDFALSFIAQNCDKSLLEVTDAFEDKKVQKPTVGKTEIKAKVVFVDKFGNAYTNLKRWEFEKFVGGGSFEIQLSKHESINQIHVSYTEVPQGEMVCFFDEADYLQIAINRGNAAQLLGLRKNKYIYIEKP